MQNFRALGAPPPDPPSSPPHCEFLATRLIEVTIIGVAMGKGARGLPSPPPNQNAINDKNVLFLHFQFVLASLQQYTRTTAITDNIDNQETRAPSIRFYNLLKCITRVKLRVCFLKVVTSGPYLTFL